MTPEQTSYAANQLHRIATLSNELTQVITNYRTYCSEDYKLTDQETYTITDLSLEDLRSILDYLGKF